ncbi:MAG: recombinase family protein [Armatimonadetes bacterium]|nr:recombinase family protein [Armatimonadota bacterium]
MSNDDTRAKVAAYVRISTDGQEEGHGLDVQRQHIAAYAAANGLCVALWYQDVESGATEERTGLAELRQAVNSGEVSTVLVSRMDRLARDVLLAEALYREFSESAQVVSVSEHFGDGFMGDLMRHILAAFAQFERGVIAARMSAGRKAAARKNGTYSGGAGVFGYRPVGKRGSPGKGALRVEESEAKAVRLAFSLRAEGRTLAGIAERLNGSGFRTVRGKQFSASQVHRILKREAFYCGDEVLTGDVAEGRAAHEPILC